MSAGGASTFDVIAYTDGGCRGNPGIGGWGYLLINAATGNAVERAGGERETTNNRMEMQAAIEALKALRKDALRVLIYSDSQYLINAMTTWMPGWKARGWKRKEGPLKNVDLLQELDRLAARSHLTWRWVKGHAGDPGNECADRLTNLAMDRIAAGADPAYEHRRVWPVKG